MDGSVSYGASMRLTQTVIPALPLWLLKDPAEGTAPGATTIVDESSDPKVGEDRRALVCRVCRSRITRRDLAMPVNGSHRHVFFNPHGMVFELGCFASAKNVLPTGQKTDEFTWFPGHVWQAVACTGCMAHLGWRYYGGEGGGFYGLILAALMEEEPGIKS